MTSFSKDATFKNRSFLPVEHVDLVTEYVAGLRQGQRYSIFYPTGSPDDYPINRSHPNHWCFAVTCINNSFTLSQRDYADGTAATISETTATTGGVNGSGVIGSSLVTGGVLWQCLMNGIAVVFAQITAATGTNENTGADTGATVPTLKGTFHAPGGISNFYEGAAASAKKDILLLIGDLMEGADRSYNLAREGWGFVGLSGGADSQAWAGLAPNRAFELGTHSRHQWNTVPNFMVIAQATVMDWNHMTTGTGGLMFPTDEVVGATIATTLAGAPARYLREASAAWYISDFGEDCIPPIWYWSSVAPQSGNFSQPFPTDIETSAHSLWWGLALKHAMKKGRVYLACTTGAVTSADGNSLASYVDRFGFADIDADGVAGISIRPENDGRYVAGGFREPLDPINFILQNINRPRWDKILPARGITRRSQVNATGRYGIPPRDDRAGVVIDCTSRPFFGEVDLLYGSSQTGCVQRIRRGERKVIEGGGPIWLAAAGDSTKVARYIAREVARV